jgi:hypothetical protein
MTRGQWLAGSFVILAAILGATVSAPWSARMFSRPESVAADPNEGEHKRTCITLGGKRFEWNFPNAPFGTLSCSE